MLEEKSLYKFYEYPPILPNNGILPLTTSPQEIQMQFPEDGKTFSSGNSDLSWDMTVPAQGAGLYSYCHLNKVPFDRLAVEVAGNVIWECQDFDIFHKAVSFACLSREKFVGKESVVCGLTISASGAGAVTDAVGECEGLNCVVANPQTGLSGPVDDGKDSLNVINAQYLTLAGVPSGTAPSNSAGSFSYISRQHLCPGVANAPIAWRCRMYFKDIADCILAYEPTLFLGNKAKILLTVSPHTKVAYNSTSATAGTTQTDLVVAPIMSNIKLNVAVEKTKSVHDKVMAQYNSGGISLVYPFVRRGYKALEAVNNLQITQADGTEVQRVWVAVQSNTPSKGTCNNNENVLGVRLLKFQPKFMGDPLLDEINCLQGYDYRHMRRNFSDTAVSGCRNYQINWVWCTSFVDNDKQAHEWTKLAFSNKGKSGVVLKPGETINYNIDSSSYAANQNIIFFPVQLKSIELKAGMEARPSPNL